MLVRVTLSSLCAGVIVEGERIVHAAPVLAWSVGKTLEMLARWTMRKNGTVEVVSRWKQSSSQPVNKESSDD